LLQLLGIGAAQDAIVERLKGNTFTCQLPLGVFMAVEVKLGIERKVGAELDKERAEVAIDPID